MQYRRTTLTSIIGTIICYTACLYSLDNALAEGSFSNKDSNAAASRSWQNGVAPVDTSENATRGNWLKKLKYFRQAESVYKKNEEDSKQLDAALKKFQEAYRVELNSCASSLKAIGMQEDDLHFIEQHYQELMLSGNGVQDYAVWKTLDIKSLFEKLYAALEQNGQLVKLIENAMNTVERQVATMRSYGDESWQKYVAIDTTYNDVMAKVLLDEMQAMNDHINAMQLYISRDLDAYCRQRIELIHEQLHVLESTRDQLRMHKFPLTRSEFDEIKKKQESIEIQSRPVDQSVWSKIWGVIAAPFVWIWTKLV